MIKNGMVQLVKYDVHTRKIKSIDATFYHILVFSIM